MKKKNKQKKARSWFSVTAFMISVLAFGVACCRYIPFTNSTESFIGVLVALLALCVTFVLGYQIINILDVKESANKIKEFEQELVETKKQTILIRAELCNENGIHHLSKEGYIVAFCLFLESLYYSIKSDDSNTNIVIENLKKVLIDWQANPKYNPNKTGHTLDNLSPREKAEELFIAITEECCEYPLYKTHKKQIEDIKTKYLNLLKPKQEKDNSIK